MRKLRLAAVFVGVLALTGPGRERAARGIGHEGPSERPIYIATAFQGSPDWQPLHLEQFTKKIGDTLLDHRRVKGVYEPWEKRRDWLSSECGPGVRCEVLGVLVTRKDGEGKLIHQMYISGHEQESTPDLTHACSLKIDPPDCLNSAQRQLALRLKAHDRTYHGAGE